MTIKLILAFIIAFLVSTAMAASILCPARSELMNVPRIADVRNTLAILRALGCRAEQDGCDVSIDSAGLCSPAIPRTLMEGMRSSVIFLGALLARCGEARISMLIAALVVLVTSASASFRSFETTVGELQGETRYLGVFGLFFSFFFSILFLAVMYFAILIAMTGSWFFSLLQGWFPTLDIDWSWTRVRFVVLFGVIFLQIGFLYRFAVPRGKPYPVIPGALIATAALVAVCMRFSRASFPGSNPATAACPSVSAPIPNLPKPWNTVNASLC